jgi:two-component system, OmpR family, response regulator ResD
VVCVVDAGGGGGAECVVVVSVVRGGGGGAACVVIVAVGVEAAGGGVGAAACVATTAALWGARLLRACRLCLWAGFASARVVAVVAGAAGGGAVVAAAALAAAWVEVEVDDPQALASMVSATAIAAIRSVFIVVSLPRSVAWVRGRRASAVASEHEAALTGSEQPVNAPPARSIRQAGAATIFSMDGHVRGSVLVVDDEPTIAEVVARYLNRAGYATRVAANGREALDAAATERPDLVVLDLMLPGIDGLEVMRRLREQDRDRVAVILLTAKGEESDRVIGLRLGADDYVVKPFSPAELVARVDAVLRRFDNSKTQEAAIELSDMTIDPTARQVFVRGEEVQLTHREFDVLLYLARHPGQAFSRNQLMDAIWQYSFYTDTSTVTVHIRRLRSKIEADPAQPQHIQTVWGVGYRFQP